MAEDVVAGMRAAQAGAVVMTFAPARHAQAGSGEHHALEDAPPPDAPPPDEPEVDQGLPPECPVHALGVHGDTYFFLDALGQFRFLKAEKMSRLNIQSLFGKSSYLLEVYWPRLTQDKETKEWVPNGWKPEEGAQVLMRAASIAGVWSPRDKVRGAGGWRGVNDELIWHLGDSIWVVPPARDGEKLIYDPGLRDSKVYPSAPPLQKPWPKMQPDSIQKGPGGRLLRDLETWQWQRPEIDPILLLGWIGAAMLGGALKWRPAAWLTGGKGTGKSSLQNYIEAIYGADGILKLDDGTEAYVRQAVRESTIPVAFDEAEPDEGGDNRKMNGLIKLARMAASGGKAGRGGSDHHGTEFILRNCFLFSSILIPSMPPQDQSRLAILSLNPLPVDGSPPKITPKQLAELGQRLMRRLADHWWRMDDTIELYRDAMRAGGHDPRGQDVFGTLLGVADVMLYDNAPVSDDLTAWAEKMAVGRLAETDVDSCASRACLQHLLTAPLDNAKDRLRMSVGDWIRAAAGQDDDVQVATAQRVLAEVGLKVDYKTSPHPEWLIVGLPHRGFAKVFAGTRWASQPGATAPYAQALKRLDHKVPLNEYGDPVPIYVGGSTMRVILLPLSLCLPPRPGGASQDASSSAPRGAWQAGESGGRQGPAEGDRLL